MNKTHLRLNVYEKYTCERGKKVEVLKKSLKKDMRIQSYEKFEKFSRCSFMLEMKI